MIKNLLLLYPIYKTKKIIENKNNYFALKNEIYNLLIFWKIFGILIICNPIIKWIPMINLIEIILLIYLELQIENLLMIDNIYIVRDYCFAITRQSLIPLISYNWNNYLNNIKLIFYSKSSNFISFLRNKNLIS
jgi:hypothetical protein